MFSGFVHPALLWGLGAAAVPLIIHLLNRRRYRRMPWAASAFLLAAYRRTRRRMRLENLLLLLARCGAVGVLALAIARPFAGVQGAVGALAERRRDEVVVVDASYSMGLREGGSTPWERALDAARGIVDAARPERGDRIEIVLAKANPEQLRAGGREEMRRELARLAEASPPQEGSDFRATLALVDRVVEGLGSGGTVRVTFATDLQRLAFAPPRDASAGPEDARPEAAGAAAASAPSGTDGAGEIARLLRSIADRGVRLRVLPVGAAESHPANLGVTAIRPDPPDQGFFAGTPIRFEATVRNHGPAIRPGVLVRFLVDGTPRGSSRVDLPAGAERSVPFEESFPDPGGHAVEASLESDALAPDDRRGYALLVRPPIRTLLVESAPDADDPSLSETGALATAVAPPEEGDARGAAFLPTILDRGAFNQSDENLADYDLVVLPNLESLTDTIVERLEAFASAGGAIAIFPGESVSPDYYNAQLRRPEGGGLLPARLQEKRKVDGREAPPFRIVPRDRAYPPFAFFTDSRYARLLFDSPVYAFFPLEPDADAIVPAVFDDPAASPAFVERRVGRGRVFLSATSARSDWWPLVERWWAVPFLYDLFRHLTTADAASLNLGVGERLRLIVDRSPLRVTASDAQGRKAPLAGEPRALGPDRWALPEFAETSRSGLYALEVETAGRLGQTEARTTRFAVDVDPAEGDLRRVEAAASSLPAFFPGVTVEVEGTAPAEEDGPDPDRGEFWRALAAACLALLVVESVLAAFFGRRRR